MKEFLPEFEFCVVDLETTGLSPRDSSIIEVGAVEISGGKIDRTFQELADPGHSIPSKITRITGLDDNDISGADPVDVVLNKFFEFASDSIFVAHNANFDLSFLSHHHVDDVTNYYIDTLRLSRELLSLESHSLGLLADHFDITIKNAHRALDDAHATAELFLELAEKIETEEDYFRCKLPEPILERSPLQIRSLEPPQDMSEDDWSELSEPIEEWIYYSLHELETNVGTNKLAKILAGSREKKLSKYRHLNSYGQLDARTQGDIKETIEDLIDRGLLNRSSNDPFPVLSLTDRSLKLLRGNLTKKS